MHDAVQSLKAKVIATDLKLDYKDIVDFYSKAKICYEQVHAEDMEAKKKEILKQQEEKKKEILKQQREWEENNRRAVDGQLLIELSDSSAGSADATVVRVYIRPDTSIYYTLNHGEKVEGTPKITVEKAFSVTLDYQPSKAVYTGATVGGITTGGVHYTQAGYTGSATSSGKGEIRVKAGGTVFELQVATMGEYAIDKFKRDPEFKRVAINGRILCWADSLEAASMLQGFLSATSYEARGNMASAYTDERRLSYDRCKEIAKFLNRVINGQFPVSDEALYGKADELSRAGTSEELKRARDIFNRIADYRDSAERAKETEKKYEEVLQAEKEKAVLEKEAGRKKGKKTAGIVAVVACAVIVLSTVVIPAIRYNNAVALMDAGEYRDAIHAFLPITDYKDSESLLSRCYISIYGEDVWNTFKDLEVGDTYVFGAYEQDNDLSNGKEDIEWMRASASMPLVSRTVKIGNYSLSDGGTSDSIPVKFMIRKGYDKIVVILTQPEGFVKKKNKLIPVIKMTMRDKPNFIKAISVRHKMYNKTLACIKKLEESGKILVIRPPEALSIGAVEHNPDELERVYRIGRKVGEEYLGKVKEYLL